MNNYFTTVSGLLVSLLSSLVVLLGDPAFADVFHVPNQAAFDRLNGRVLGPGDEVRFRRGREFVGGFVVAGAGTRAEPILIGSYGKGPRPVIHARGRHDAGLKLVNVQHCEVSELEITNTDGSDADQGDLFGIYVLAENPGAETLNHVYIRDCYVHDVNAIVAGKDRGGIYVWVRGDQPARFHDLRIENNRVERVGGVGIANQSPFARPTDDDDPRFAHYSTGVVVRGNRISTTGANNVIARASKNALYERNLLAHSSRATTGHSIFCFNTLNITIQHNEVYGNTGKDSKDRGAFDADYNCRNTTIQYNYSHDNEWFCGIMKRWNKGVVIRYNVSFNERRGLYFYGFDHAKAAEDIQIYSNTHVVTGGSDFEVFPEGRRPINSTFKNNLFLFVDTEPTWGRGFHRRHNTRFEDNLYLGIDPPAEDASAPFGNPSR